MAKQVIIPILFLSCVLSGCANYIISEKKGETYYPDGSLKTKGSNTYKRLKKQDRFEYYQKWDNEFETYYQDRTLKSKYISIHKRATYGKNCKEILSHYIEYNKEGNKVFEQKDVCDCEVSITKMYDQTGKLISREKIRTKMKEPSKKSSDK